MFLFKSLTEKLNYYEERTEGRICILNKISFNVWVANLKSATMAHYVSVAPSKGFAIVPQMSFSTTTVAKVHGTMEFIPVHSSNFMNICFFPLEMIQ